MGGPFQRCTGLREREDDPPSVQRRGDRGADVLSLTQGVWRLQVDQAKRLKELHQENVNPHLHANIAGFPTAGGSLGSTAGTGPAIVHR